MNNSDLRSLYNAHTGKISDKWSIYFPIYDKIFSDYRNERITLLEIGIQNGGSLELWAKFFPNAARFVGNDIAEKCKDLKFSDERIEVIVADGTLDETRQKISQLSDKYDIIIDDGSHVSEDIIKAFCLYFPLLKEGGIFVAEDLHCSYWKEYGGGLYDPYSSINFFKLLIDAVNYEHWGISKSRKSLFDGFSKNYGITIDEELLSKIHSIEFINSICVIKKLPPDENQLGERVVAGKDESVFTGLKDINGVFIQAKPQEDNFWTNRSLSPAEEFLSLTEQNSSLSTALFESSALTHEREQEIANLSQKYISASALAEERAEELAQLAEKHIAASAVNENREHELKELSQRYISASALAEERAEELAQLSEKYIVASTLAEERGKEIAGHLNQMATLSARIEELESEMRRLKKSIFFRIRKLFK